MRLTHLGHAGVLVESGDARILIDPGSFSSGFERERIDAVLVTHRHADHLDSAKVTAVLERNPQASLWLESSTPPDGIDPARIVPVSSGDELTIAGVAVRAVGGTHARIHADIDLIPNVGYFFPDEGFLHPGDELIELGERVRVLAAPISGPWQALEDAVDYVRAVGPDIAVPIHEGMLARPQIYIDYLTKLAPGTRVQPLVAGRSTEL